MPPAAAQQMMLARGPRPAARGLVIAGRGGLAARAATS
jgi:hypothetical protein